MLSKVDKKKLQKRVKNDDRWERVLGEQVNEREDLEPGSKGYSRSLNRRLTIEILMASRTAGARGGVFLPSYKWGKKTC